MIQAIFSAFARQGSQNQLPKRKSNKVKVAINLPVGKVIELFTDKANFKEWKKGFVSYEHISGTPGEVGAVTKLVTRQGTMYDQIIAKNLPFEIIETYEHKRGNKTTMVHKAVNKFVRITDNTTLVEVNTEIIEVHGALLKLILKLMAKAGERYSQQQLNQFKVFAEK
jgi:hypothetical protein